MKNIFKDKLDINIFEMETISTDKVNASFVYKLALKDYIMRILVLGSRTNKYDQRTKKLAEEDIAYVDEQIQAGKGGEILDIVKEVYENSRAPNFNNTFLLLAMLCRAEDIQLKSQSLQVIEKFRTISHLYSWKNFHAIIPNPESGEKSKGFGRAVKREINKWILAYRDKPLDLAYQITKYQSREGWSFKNLLQCSHVSTKTGDNRGLSLKPKTPNPNDVPPTEIDLVLRYTVNGIDAMVDLDYQLNYTSEVYTYLRAVYFVKHCSVDDKEDLIKRVYQFKLTREQVPSWCLADVDVLTALLVNKEKTHITMPITALLRNLGNMTSHGVYHDPMLVDLVFKHLMDPHMVKNSRIHPVSVLTAWFTYNSGNGNKGSNTWSPNFKILKALEEMFYLSFLNVEPTGKRICFLIDCSGSMGNPSLCDGVTNAEAAALLAMIFARSEKCEKDSPTHAFYLFTCKNDYYGRGTTGLTDISDVIDARAPLENVLNAVQRSDWGTTDISLGILEALKYKRKYDAFVVITDNDVNSGIKPVEAIKQYRTCLKMPHTKLVVVATQGADYTIADPEDPFMLDMCGFDSHGPRILQDFIRS
jgi:60 kDa SS-A/Ro ribonucleoprotein